jgi:hypothetical protein
VSIFFQLSITYKMNFDSYVGLDAYSGRLYLQSSLRETTFTNLTYSITAVCGILESKTPFLLTVTVSDSNSYSPVFDSHLYRVKVNKSVPIGTKLLQLHAQDVDTPVLGYSIVDGDPTGRFSLEPLTGRIMKLFCV